jgi:hypothetical protein
MSSCSRQGQRVVFDAPSTGWHGVSHGPHVNLANDVLAELIDVEFDHAPGVMYLCKLELLKPEPRALT